jgi:membrane-associated phospholipid phosphatase
VISTDTSANAIERVAVLWLSGYLAATGLIFVTDGEWALAALHAALIAVGTWALWHTESNGLKRLIRDLLPLIVAPLLYGEIPMLIAAVGATYHDVAVQAWEARLFGGQPARTLAARLPWTAVSELLHAGYLAYYPLIFVPPLLLLARGERRGYAETVLALTVAYTVCWTIFIIFPVQGPRYLWGPPPGIPAGPMRRLAVHVLAAGSSRGAAFPSSHMAVSGVQALMACRWQPRGVAVPTTAIAVLVGLGAVYGGFHYAVDMIAGAVLGGLVWLSVTTGMKRMGRQ